MRIFKSVTNVCKPSPAFAATGRRHVLACADNLPACHGAAFIIMKLPGVEANIVALSGIAIAIGVMVDVGVVGMENVVRHVQAECRDPQTGEVAWPRGGALEKTILSAVSEGGPAVTTGMATTIISFLPVFAMQAQEGKMFHPLALTKTFALLSSLVPGLVILPTLAYWIFSLRLPQKWALKVFKQSHAPRTIRLWHWNIRQNYVLLGIIVLLATCILTGHWMPLTPKNGMLLNMVFVLAIIAVVLTLLWLMVVYYERILRWCLDNRWKFMMIPPATLACGGWVWYHTGAEFMPSLDEGTFMPMPTSMPHSGVEQNPRLCRQLDLRVSQIPEVESVVGKRGRAGSALDPAPIQMYETTVNYRPEYMPDDDGQRASFKTDGKGRFVLKGGATYDPAKGFRIIPRNSLIPSSRGEYLRQWRDEIKTEDGIWT